MNATIQSIEPTPREWKKDGELCGYFVQGTLREGGTFSVFAKTTEQAAAHLAALGPQIGKTQELELERRGEYNGVPKFDLKSYPGMPASPPRGGGGGGRAAYVPRFRDTAEGFALEQASIHRSVSLAQAVLYCNASDGASDPRAVLAVADAFHEWLSDGSHGPSEAQRAAAPRPASSGRPVESTQSSTDRSTDVAVASPEHWRLSTVMSRVYGKQFRAADVLAKASVIMTSIRKQTVKYESPGQMSAAEARQIHDWLITAHPECALPDGASV